MRATEIVDDLLSQAGRAAGSDAERRGALALAERLRAAGRAVQVQPLWVRPRRAAAGALHAGLAVAASLTAVSAPVVGAAVLGAVLISALLDALALPSPGRRCTPERATQNVVSPAPGDGSEPVHLVVSASCDAAPGGLLSAAWGFRLRATIRRRAGAWLPGPAGITLLAIALVLTAAVLRAAGLSGRWLDVVQLVPTVALLLALAALLDAAVAPVASGAGEAGGAAAALLLVEALDASPPRNLGVELVLAGASQAGGLGLSAYVRARRRAWPPERTVLLHFDSCAQGRPRWWRRQGTLLSRRAHPRLLELAAHAARERPELGATAWPGDGATAPGAARLRGWPALTVGCLAPGSGARATGAAVDPRSVEDAADFALALVRGIDADVGARMAAAPPAGAAAPAPR